MYFFPFRHWSLERIAVSLETGKLHQSAAGLLDDFDDMEHINKHNNWKLVVLLCVLFPLRMMVSVIEDSFP